MVCDADSGGRGRQSEPELAVLTFSIGLPELEENLRLPRAIGRIHPLGKLTTFLFFSFLAYSESHRRWKQPSIGVFDRKC